MRTMLQKIKLYVTTHKVLSSILLVVILFVGYSIYNKATSTTGETRYITTKVSRGTIMPTVSGTGQVSASNQIDIKPKASGEVTYLAVQSGQEVGAGALIASLDASDARKAVRDAEANLASAKIALQKQQIQDSDENLNADLIKAYDDGFNTVSSAFLDLPSITAGLNELFGQYNLSENSARIVGSTAQDYRSRAESAYYAADAALSANKNFYRTLSHSSSKENIEKIIEQTYATTVLISDAIKDMRNFVDYMAQNTGNASNFVSAQNTLSSDTGTINGHLSSLLSIKTTIKDDKDAFLNSDLDLQSSNLSLQQKQNALQDAQETLADYSIRAPFAGTIASINIKRSDSVSSGTIAATIITREKLAEISMNEVDVAKIKLEQKADLTFDAIPDLNISGSVIEIDSVGTVSQGVVTYMVKISFDMADPRIKPAMSVSASIITDMKEGVLIVPNSAIKSQKGTSYVEMFSSSLPQPTDGFVGSISSVPPAKIPVEIGLADDGATEIISGLEEGDEIVSRTILPGAAKAAAAAPSFFGSAPATRNTSTSGGNNTRFVR